MATRKYAIHPGFVGAKNLAVCYGLKPSQYIIWDIQRPETIDGRKEDDYIHLFPRPNGDYREILELKEQRSK